MINDLILKSFDRKKMYRKNAPEDQQPLTSPATPMASGIPTLKNGVYRDCSPMLQVRYEMFGRWTRATHGDWLGIHDMEELWKENIEDKILLNIKLQRIAAEENWPNEASALFRPDRLSLFAGSHYGNEKIYLLWLDFEDEPEFWVYDSNGESRYRDIEAYLTAYLNDDQNASTLSWRA